MDTRSGELLSAAIAAVVALSLLFQPSSPMFMVLEGVRALPEWAILATLSSLVSIWATFSSSVKLQMIARFWSGCLWGTIILIYAIKGPMAVIFWCSVVLFLFDLILVVHKGTTWTKGSRC